MRLRLVLSFALVLAAAVAALGVVVTRSTAQALTAQVDQRLDEIGRRNPSERGSGPQRRPVRDPQAIDRPRPDGERPGGSGLVEARLFAHLVLERDGTVLSAEPAGFAADPLPLPDVSGFAGPGAALLVGQIVTLEATEGEGRYRATVLASGEVVEVFATSLDPVDQAVDRLTRTFGVTGLAVIVVGGAAAWWTVRRGLRPVDAMVDTAAAIASGERDRRVPEERSPAELARLAAALNEMLEELDAAFRAESQAKASLTRFVADASHELRTPLAAVAGYAELFQRGALTDPAEAERAIHRIRSETTRMRHLVDDLLVLARFDSRLDAGRDGGPPSDHRAQNLAAVVRDAVADSEAIEPGRPVRARTPETLTVHGDAGQLTQVVANLLSNARIHTPAGTAVEVDLEADRDAGLARLTVADHGPGIPADQLDRVFERFWRVDKSRARSTGGSGLGLAIVAAIVASHGGSVEVANGGAAPGARFTVILPLAGGGGVAAPAQPAAAHSGGTRR
jgi:two-component system OmpR family sensor kinase